MNIKMLNYDHLNEKPKNDCAYTVIFYVKYKYLIKYRISIIIINNPSLFI